MSDPALILAAGASSRFGTPKQRFCYRGTPLVLRAVHTAKQAGLHPVVVVGAHRESVEDLLSPDIDRVFNPGWETGMASSIRSGVQYLIESSHPDRLLIIACDQPEISADDLIRLHRAGGDDQLCAATYEDVIGIPACFPARYFDDLLELQGDRGARELLRGSKYDVHRVPMPRAAFDIDTPGDLEHRDFEKPTPSGRSA